MPNGKHETRISVNETKIDTIHETCNRIESKIDGWPSFCSAKHEGVNKRLAGKVGWLQAGIVLSIFASVFAILKYAPVLAALL